MKRGLSVLVAFVLLLSVFPLMAEEGLPGAGDMVVTVTSEARELKKGDKGDDVKSLQTRLRVLQYYTGPVTGNYLEQTARAVKAVQQAYGMSETGQADLATLDIIYGDAYRPLNKGASGEDVKRLQTRLSELGYYWGQISGNYLDGTTAAISNFQKDNGILSNGKADVATQMRLFSDDIVMPTPDPHATAPPSPAPTAPPDTRYPGKLSYGSTGKGVERLQRQLAYLGFFDRKVTSGFYKHTQASVKEFQRYNGLVQDGEVGENTWQALFAADVVYASAATPRPTPEPTPIPYFVEVDVANQLIKIYRRDANQEFTDLYKIFTASTGTAKFPSDVGTWTLTGRNARWAEFPTWGGGLAQYWTQITPSIAFHSFLYTSGRQVNMGSVKALGRPASHGCIRLTIPDAKWIYDHIGKGVQVYIHEDAVKDPELKYANRPGEFSQKAGRHLATPEPTQTPLYQPGIVPAELRSLKVGSEGEDVFWLQNRLKELGLYPGTVTGQYREGTRDAVKAYQRANRLKADGVADRKTQELLQKQTLEELSLQVEPTPGPTPEATADPAFVVGGG